MNQSALFQLFTWSSFPYLMKLTYFPQCRIFASVNCVRIGSGNGLVPVWRQAITWTNADLLSIGPLGTNFTECKLNRNKKNFSSKKIYLKMSSAIWRTFFPMKIQFICAHALQQDGQIAYNSTACHGHRPTHLCGHLLQVSVTYTYGAQWIKEKLHVMWKFWGSSTQI